MSEKRSVKNMLSKGFQRAPWWLRLYLPFAVWRVSSNERAIYLTFDDGPTPKVTEQVLEILDKFDAKGTFFCLGQQAAEYPELVQAIQRGGHAIGNHTFSHVNGWTISQREYLKDIDRAEQVIRSIVGGESMHFRPPFGRMKPWHWLRFPKAAKCYMWDITAEDFVKDISATEVTDIVLNYVRDGSIVLLHDSLEAGPIAVSALPSILRSLKSQGYRLKSLWNTSQTG